MVTFKFVLVPEQIVAVPLNTDAVAGLLTVTTALPDNPELGQPLASVTETKLYVVVTPGLTGILVPLV